jgi:heptosyltransferase-2
MNILIIALSGIGDALMFTPALKLLREKLPEAHIDALVMFAGVRDIYSRNPNLNNVFYFNFMKEGPVKSLLYLFKLRGKYDITINVYPSNRREYNLISFLLGAKKRAAVEYLRMNKDNFGFLNNVTVKENDALHNVEENTKLVEKLLNIPSISKNQIPALELQLTGEDYSAANRCLEKYNISREDLVIGFHPGCATLKNHIKRRWEPEKFSLLAEKLIKEYKAKVLVFGGPEEEDLKKTVAAGAGSSDAIVVNTENLAQNAAVMKRCNLFITNDSSLMHVASADPVKTPEVHPEEVLAIRTGVAEFSMVVGIGFLIVIVSTGISSVMVLRMKPKEIFSSLS